MNQLTFPDRAAASLTKAIDANEVKSIRDKAEALKSYAGRATEMGRQCTVTRKPSAAPPQPIKENSPGDSPGLSFAF